MPRHQNRLLANEIMQTTRSAGPRRNRHRRPNHIESWWPIAVVLVLIGLSYFLSRMV